MHNNSCFHLLTSICSNILACPVRQFTENVPGTCDLTSVEFQVPHMRSAALCTIAFYIEQLAVSCHLRNMSITARQLLQCRLRQEADGEGQRFERQMCSHSIA